MPDVADNQRSGTNILRKRRFHCITITQALAIESSIEFEWGERASHANGLKVSAYRNVDCHQQDNVLRILKATYFIGMQAMKLGQRMVSRGPTRLGC